MNEGQPRRAIVEIKTRVERDFPSDPHERFEAIFAAMGWSEAVALTMLGLERTPQTYDEIHKKFVKDSGGAWKTGRTLQGSYCLNSLVPIGMVAAVNTLYDGASEYILGFRANEAGIYYGKPIAARLLEESAQLPFSFQEIFRRAAPGGGETRPVLNVVDILEYLAAHPGFQREADIVTETGANQVATGRHLERLSDPDLGVLEYFSITPGVRGFAPRTLAQDARRDDVKIRDYYELTGAVADLLFELGTVDASSLTPLLQPKFSDKNVDSLRHGISHILAHLTTQGICDPVIFIGREIHSQAKLTDRGRKIVENVIQPIREALRDNTELLSAWGRIPWWEYTYATIAKYQKASGPANRRSPQEWNRIILNAITEHQGITRRDLERLLRHQPDETVQALIQDNQIRIEIEGRTHKYYPQEAQASAE